MSMKQFFAALSFARAFFAVEIKTFSSGYRKRGRGHAPPCESLKRCMYEPLLLSARSAPSASVKPDLRSPRLRAIASRPFG